MVATILAASVVAVAVGILFLVAVVAAERVLGRVAVVVFAVVVFFVVFVDVVVRKRGCRGSEV